MCWIFPVNIKYTKIEKNWRFIQRLPETKDSFGKFGMMLLFRCAFIAFLFISVRGGLLKKETAVAAATPGLGGTAGAPLPFTGVQDIPLSRIVNDKGEHIDPQTFKPFEPLETVWIMKGDLNPTLADVSARPPNSNPLLAFKQETMELLKTLNGGTFKDPYQRDPSTLSQVASKNLPDVTQSNYMPVIIMAEEDDEEEESEENKKRSSVKVGSTFQSDESMVSVLVLRVLGISLCALVLTYIYSLSKNKSEYQSSNNYVSLSQNL